MTTYRDWIRRELEIRSRRRPGYSLRAFARDIGMPAPKLSQMLRGICGISTGRAVEIADRLKFSLDEKDLFITLVESEHSRSALGKKKAQDRLKSLNASDGFGELSLERFRIISEWQHFAILELTEVSDFKSEAGWIAKRLGITKEDVILAIQRLEDFGLIKKDEKGRYRQTHVDLATPSGIPSKEIRTHHSQMLQLADQALEEVSIELRDFSTMTMAISTTQLVEARKYLKEFRRKFCKDLQNQDSKNRVYALNIQLFPLDKIEERTSK